MIDILIIDDDAVFGELTLERFEGTPWSVEFHKGPFGTVNAIRAARPRLIVLDVNMPGLNGTGISEILRKTTGLAYTRVLLYSSLDRGEVEELARQCGADAALNKSATREALLAAASRLLR
jgi:CheY-like chemotaxis protein